jgi:hypothetical protein
MKPLELEAFNLCAAEARGMKVNWDTLAIEIPRG